MQLEKFKILTVTHKRTNLKEIGNFVVKAQDKEILRSRLESLKVRFQLEELFYVSTCNRVMYFFTTSQTLDDFFVSHFFQSINPDLSLDTLHHIDDYSQLLEGKKALNHFFDVAASIDSLVVGERQILGQLREAYDQCQEWGLTDDSLRIVFQQAVVAAKAVYAKTSIGDKPVSVVSLAVQKLLKTNLEKDARILLIGAGQTNQLVAKFLVKHHFNNVVVFNRSLNKAEQLAELAKGEAQPLEKLSSYIGGFDCLIVCTGATTPIITKALYQQLLQGETDQKVIIDLAIPHNTATEVTESFAVNYIEIDGLRNLAKENLAFREMEVSSARKLLNDYLSEFPALLKQRQIELALQAIPSAVKAVKAKAINEVFGKEVAELDTQTRDLLERMLTYMEKKCIGIPMKAAREAVL